MSVVVADARLTRSGRHETTGRPVYRVTRRDSDGRAGTCGFVTELDRGWAIRPYGTVEWLGRFRLRRGAVVDLLARHAREVAA